MTELLLGLDIVRELDITVVFGSDHFRVGKGELEMMTYNEKHHWVLPLVPTACDYAKLGGYFGNCKIADGGPASAGRFRGSCGSSESDQNQKSNVGKQNGGTQNDCFGRERFNSE